ncbi:hypothetical protein [Flavobacterium sp. N1994]|uniref:hypothetical protein n=1 Tax=Flavobacterium sp. N1994 TaxID=2986827 RepID=UPI002221D147|nr:hypothetical protein [Flavobacterium sp. N1994]
MSQNIEIIKYNGKKVLEANLSGLGYFDEINNKHVLVIPSMMLASSGSTEEEARNFLTIQVELLMSDFNKMGESNFYAEIRELGWEKNDFFKKRVEKSEMTFDDAKKMFNIPEKAELKKMAMEF